MISITFKFLSCHYDMYRGVSRIFKTSCPQDKNLWRGENRLLTCFGYILFIIWSKAYLEGAIAKAYICLCYFIWSETISHCMYLWWKENAENCTLKLLSFYKRKKHNLTVQKQSFLFWSLSIWWIWLTVISFIYFYT